MEYSIVTYSWEIFLVIDDNGDLRTFFGQQT